MMSFLILPGRMCSNKEEVYEDEETANGQATVEDVAANWKKFMVTADKMVAISENNLTIDKSKWVRVNEMGFPGDYVTK